MIMEPNPPVNLAACHPAPMLAQPTVRNELSLADKQTTGRMIWPRSQFPDRYLGENEPECFEETSGSFPGGAHDDLRGRGGGAIALCELACFRLRQAYAETGCSAVYIKEVRDTDLLAQHNRAGISRMHAAGSAPSPRSSTDASLSIILANTARLPPDEMRDVKHVAPPHPPILERVGLQ
ncbi:uncharacterized protein LY79DRAFT_18082 [Colletotrichum navitas]|uniref:Uncharacterized protein n=1 Tax=Colletotrichum navitas TaxID=681940 RepID=A0AAD8VDB0_9PEZI|nr:uncharacterized protein LY79DRAFT_18082 [Colletotrichum navitas]KAK1600410.1 hypothetical protein LY79DRAFT_18082 [Colletotrichum navitas]